MSGSPLVRAQPAGSPRAESAATVPNAITLVRTTGAVVLGVAAIATAAVWPVVVGYVVYWLGDVLDGAAARWLDQETRHGAVLDIVCDRACTCILVAAYLVHVPEAALPLCVFLLQFTVLDTLLSLSFLHWPILGPNDFGQVDTAVHRLNWTPLAKTANTALVLVLVVSGQVVAATAAATAILTVKAWSTHRVLGLLRHRRSS
ncbi:MAG: CDP-alcohol phosphatidyltransferase family protein [Phycicoccus sp.]